MLGEQPRGDPTSIERGWNRGSCYAADLATGF